MFKPTRVQNALTAMALTIGVMQADPARAIVVIGEPNFGLDDSEALGDPFTAVVDLFVSGVGSGSGILIDSTHVLTAKHVTNGTSSASNIFVDFNDANGDRIGSAIRGASYVELADPVSNVDLIDGTDLAIITLQSAVTGITPMKLLDDMSFAVGKEALTVGFGFHGEGNVVDGNGDPILDFGDIRYAGANTIDAYGQAQFSNGPNTLSANIFSTDFDDGTAGGNTLGNIGSSQTSLAQESTTAPGDSGGPLLVQVGGEWVVAGVLSGGSTNTSGYGDISFWTGVGPHRDWIEANSSATFVPEPGSLALLGLGGVMLLRRRG